MPVLEQIIPPRGKEFWDAFDLGDTKQILEAVKEEFERPVYELHHFGSFGSITRDHPIGFSMPCYRDCLIFLLRGEFIIKGQGRVTETGCAYRVKDEVWLWLCGTTTIVVIEEGEQRGACLRRTQETQELRRVARDGSRKERKRAKKLLDERRQARSDVAQFL